MGCLGKAGRPEKSHGLAQRDDTNRSDARQPRGRSRLCGGLDHLGPRDARYHHRGVDVRDLSSPPGPNQPCGFIRFSSAI